MFQQNCFCTLTIQRSGIFRDKVIFVLDGTFCPLSAFSQLQQMALYTVVYSLYSIHYKTAVDIIRF